MMPEKCYYTGIHRNGNYIKVMLIIFEYFIFSSCCYKRAVFSDHRNSQL